MGTFHTLWHFWYVGRCRSISCVLFVAEVWVTLENSRTMSSVLGEVIFSSGRLHVARTGFSSKALLSNLLVRVSVLGDSGGCSGMPASLHYFRVGSPFRISRSQSPIFVLRRRVITRPLHD